MHTLLLLASLLLVVVGGSRWLAIPRRRGDRARRRAVPVVVLAAPVVSLGLGIGGLPHFAGRVCFLGAPPWDYTLGLALPAAMGLVALGGIGLGLARLALMARLVARRGAPAGGELQAWAEALAARLGAARPRLLLCPYDRPLAFTCGLARPAVLLSTWMVEHLDRRELEAVLAHELGHAARRDYLLIWVATVLRDAFPYLPTSWAAHRQLRHEQEAACDDLAVGATGQPLALASALAKVWQHALDGPRITAAPSLVGAGAGIEGRIERLLAAPRPAPDPVRSRAATLGAGAAALVGLLAVEAAAVAVMLAPMGCGPASPLWRVLA